MSVELIYINQRQLELLFKGHQPFILAYLRSHCPDSHYGLTEFLLPYLESCPLKGYIYAYDFEANGHYDLTSLTYRDSYQAFLDTWGLSSKTNPTLGYGKGHVPSFQYIEPNGLLPRQDISVIKDNLVIYNDKRQERSDDLVVIGETFFDGTRPLRYASINLKGRMLPAWRRVEIGVFHNKLAKDFFDYYLPKVTTNLLIDP